MCLGWAAMRDNQARSAGYMLKSKPPSSATWVCLQTDVGNAHRLTDQIRLLA